MKLNKLAVITSVTSLVILAGSIAAPKAHAEVKSNSNLIVAQNDVIARGNFVTVDKTTRGQVNIIEENGRRYIELSSNFRTSSGPQVEVILHRNNTVPKSIASRDYITLSPLRNFRGNQRYLIPNNVDLDDFNSVAIWCRQFNVTFGYASI